MASTKYTRPNKVQGLGITVTESVRRKERVNYKSSPKFLGNKIIRNNSIGPDANLIRLKIPSDNVINTIYSRSNFG